MQPTSLMPNPSSGSQAQTLHHPQPLIAQKPQNVQQGAGNSRRRDSSESLKQASRSIVIPAGATASQGMKPVNKGSDIVDELNPQEVVSSLNFRMTEGVL